MSFDPDEVYDLLEDGSLVDWSYVAPQSGSVITRRGTVVNRDGDPAEPGPWGEWIQVQDDDGRHYLLNLIDEEAQRYWPEGRDNSRGTVTSQRLGDLTRMETITGSVLLPQEDLDA